MNARYSRGALPDEPLDGVWHTPGRPDSQIWATLRLGPERSTLHVVSDDSLPEWIEILHGYIMGRTVTLRHLQLFHREIGTPGFATSDYIITQAFIGALVNDFLVTAGEFAFEYLSEWRGRTRITPRQPEGGDERARVIDYTPSAIASVDLPVGTLTLSEKLWDRPSAPSVTALQPAASFEIRPSGPTEFDELVHSVIRPLQSFLTLATGRPNALTHLRVQHSAASLADPDDARPATDADPRWAEVIEDLRRDSSLVLTAARPLPGSDARAFDPGEMAFSFDDIESDFGATIQDWFIAVDEFRAATDVYFGGKYQRAPHLETRFLQNCQVAEIIHRTRFGDEVVPKDEFRKMWEPVLDEIKDREQRKTVWRALRESNRKFLRDRLTELLANAPSTVTRLVDDVGEFVGQVVASRNYFTHYGGGEERAVKGRDLLVLNAQLDLLIYSQLLSELGPLAQRVDELVSGTRLAREVEFWTGAPKPQISSEPEPGQAKRGPSEPSG